MKTASRWVYDPAVLMAMKRLAVSLSEIIATADYYGRLKEKEQAWKMMDGVLDDVSVMLEESPRLSGRFPKMPKSFEETLEELRVARDVELIAIELLREDEKHPVEYKEARLEKARNILDALKLRINLTKPIVMERWPGKWTPEIEAEFEKVLKLEL